MKWQKYVKTKLTLPIITGVFGFPLGFWIFLSHVHKPYHRCYQKNPNHNSIANCIFRSMKPLFLIFHVFFFFWYNYLFQQAILQSLKHNSIWNTASNSNNTFTETGEWNFISTRFWKKNGNSCCQTNYFYIWGSLWKTTISLLFFSLINSFICR